MKTEVGNLWDYIGKVDAICIPTNGFVTSSGRAVMGRGVAKQALDKFIGIDKILAEKITKLGNIPAVLMETKEGTVLVSFPVKDTKIVSATAEDIAEHVVSHAKNLYKVGNLIPGYHLKADYRIIRTSAVFISHFAKIYGFDSIALPRVGAGAGERSWRIIEEILDRDLIPAEKFVVVVES